MNFLGQEPQQSFQTTIFGRSALVAFEKRICGSTPQETHAMLPSLSLVSVKFTLVQRHLSASSVSVAPLFRLPSQFCSMSAAPADRIDVDCVVRFLQLTDDCNAHKTVAGDYGYVVHVVSGHVTGGAASTNRTDLIVIAQDDMEDAKAVFYASGSFKVALRALRNHEPLQWYSRKYFFCGEVEDTIQVGL